MSTNWDINFPKEMSRHLAISFFFNNITVLKSTGREKKLANKFQQNFNAQAWIEMIWYDTKTKQNENP